MPQFNVGFPERRATIERRFADHPGLFIAGSAVGAVGLPDCIRSAEQAAAQAEDFLDVGNAASHSASLSG